MVPYLAVAAFGAAVVIRWLKIARMPVHLRWELYPIAHEANAPHGGPFVEHAPSGTSRLGDLKVMLAEILLLRGVHAHNRSLWLRSYPFHFGLYLLATFIGLLALGAMVEALGIRVAADASGPGLLLCLATTIAGLAGLFLMGLGALALLLHRLCDPALRGHSAIADFFNLIAFFIAAVMAILAFAISDREFSFLRGFMRASLTLRPVHDLPALVIAEVLVGCALFAYIPLTHMSHFFTKWFMYHDVRWNNEVNRVGSSLEATIARQLGLKVRWSASHIRGDGKKTWAEVATEEVAKP